MINEHAEAFRIRDLMARAMEPEAWAEYEEAERSGDEKMSGRNAHKVMDSIVAATRAYLALRDAGIELPPAPDQA